MRPAFPLLRDARILLSNDDGFEAPGLTLLRRLLTPHCDDVWVVAPASEHSGAGHSLTLQRPLRIRECGPKAYSVDGTPTDCVLLAINRIMRDHRPDYVFSGINRGANLAEDVTYSGTVAAAIEATLLGIPAIAFSQDLPEDREIDAEGDYQVAREHLVALAEKLTLAGWPSHTLLNVNFPSVAADDGVRVLATRQGRLKIGDCVIEAHDPRGRPCYWIGNKRMASGTAAQDDAGAVAAGSISVTPIKTDFTNHAALARLSEALA